MLQAVAIYLAVAFVGYLLDPNPAPRGYTHADPCFACGEDWQFYPPNGNKTAIVEDNPKPQVVIMDTH